MPRRLKVVLLGRSRAGKTSLLARLGGGAFRESVPSTIGGGYGAFALGAERVEVWDTGGDPRYSSLAHMYYRNAHVALLVFDLTDSASLAEAGDWVGRLAGRDLRVLLVGTKVDRLPAEYSDRHVAEQARVLARRCRLPLVCTSAKTNHGVAGLRALLTGRSGAPGDRGARECLVTDEPPPGARSRCCCCVVLPLD